MAIIRKNHYVPVWYQNRFLPDGEESLFHMDLYPQLIEVPDGRVVKAKDVHSWGPKNCFWAKDLYTTIFFGIPNDEIERYLFGDIDAAGSKALRALVDQDLAKLSHLFRRFFEYIDAQKLRTPKGLDWIRSHYPALHHVELMHEMQLIRRMHCTMWLEGVREIVSAENANVKFIISDHPVTAYNYACSPESEMCKYPDDPSIALKASQTLFPLDLNHCLILTNLEYAQSPKKTDPLSDRTYARFYGQTITRFDTMIRERRLTDAEVTAINFVLKARARGHIAAARKEYLYPERYYTGSWQGIQEVLLPPEDKLWEFGGEIFVGGKSKEDTYYQDEFGRTTYRSERLHKETKEDIGRNDLCPCGSGKKYKKCCLGKPPSQRPTFDEYSIRERNLMLIKAVNHILGLNKGKTWEDVRRELNGEQVKQIYQVVGVLWPRETDLMSLLPHPDLNVFRALYTGLVDPRVAIRNVIGFSMYADEVLVISPFLNPRGMKDKYSPVHSPEGYKQEIIKNVLLLLMLEPFIRKGIVNMIPDPGDFDFALREETWGMARERLKDWKPDKKGMGSFENLAKDDFTRIMYGLPDESIKRKMRAAIPDITEEGLSQALEYIKKMKVLDPLSILQPLEPGPENAQYMLSHFGVLELCLFIAQVTGSFVYTDSIHRWNEILASNDTMRKAGAQSLAVDVEKALSRRFPFVDQVHPWTALEIRGSQRLAEIRRLFRQIWARASTSSEDERETGETKKLLEEFTKARFALDTDWKGIQKRLRKEIKGAPGLVSVTIEANIDWRLPAKGFGLNSVYRLLFTHSRRTDYMRSMPMAVFVSFIEQ